MGAALEDYIKNAFADCIGKDQRTINSQRNTTFSYLGNNTNPPDAMLNGSDAIEIKKVESAKTPYNLTVAFLRINYIQVIQRFHVNVKIAKNGIQKI